MTKAFGEIVDAPSGTICLWAGLLADIPAGWVICDGMNGTPNLLDQFCKETPDTATNPGATGGQSSYTLTTSQLPPHNHSAASTDTLGDHDHGTSESSGVSGTYTWIPYSLNDPHGTTTLNGGHSHKLDIGSTGGSSAINNTPAFYEVAFIQKT